MYGYCTIFFYKLEFCETTVRRSLMLIRFLRCWFKLLGLNVEKRFIDFT